MPLPSELPLQAVQAAASAEGVDSPANVKAVANAYANAKADAEAQPFGDTRVLPRAGALKLEDHQFQNFQTDRTDQEAQKFREVYIHGCIARVKALVLGWARGHRRQGPAVRPRERHLLQSDDTSEAHLADRAVPSRVLAEDGETGTLTDSTGTAAVAGAPAESATAATSATATSAPTAGKPPPGLKLSPKSYYVAHGWLMWAAFGVFFPLGILTAGSYGQRLTRHWFNAHVALQMLGWAAATASGLLSLVKFDALFALHSQVGLAVLVLVWLQPLLALPRPQKGGRSRVAWVLTHWLLGVTAVALGWVDMYWGMDLMRLMFRDVGRVALLSFLYLLAQKLPPALLQGRAAGAEKPAHSSNWNARPENGAAADGDGESDGVRRGAKGGPSMV
eukprot:jgi/Mesen1/3357/ME000191S02496